MFIETYVLEADLYRGCIKHIREESYIYMHLCARDRLKKEAVYSM